MLDDLYGKLEIPQYIIDYALQQVLICEVLCGVFFMIAFFWNIASSFIKSKGEKVIDVNILSRTIIIAAILPFYVPMAWFVFEFLDTINHYSQYQNVIRLIETSTEVLKTSSLDETGKEIASDYSFAAIGDMFSDIVKSVKFAIMNIPTVLIKTIADAIRIIIQMLTNVLILVFFVMGPYALVFSILPTFESKLEQWFKTYFTLCFVPITFNIMDGVYYSLVNSVVQSNGVMAGVVGFVDILLLSVCMIILYTLPFWITGKVVGSADAGRFLSQTMQIASMGVGSAMSKVMSKIPGVSGTSNSASNVASASKDAMSK
jgi:hypothetical protein